MQWGSCLVSLVIMYHDDVEVCNPLGSYRGVHKLGKSASSYIVINLRKVCSSLMHCTVIPQQPLNCNYTLMHLFGNHGNPTLVLGYTLWFARYAINIIFSSSLLLRVGQPTS